MRARLIVFPIKGRNWCFSRSIDRFAPDPSSSSSSYRVPSTFTDLWTQISSNRKPLNANAGLLVDFVSNKMNGAWAGLEKAPEGSMKNKLYGLGLKLLARVKPSEIFLKSITNEVNSVDITYPTSLNARLVRRRLRHIALRGTIIHKKYFYGSVTLLPLTTVLTVLPLPNIPFFWILFRTYSHWRALKGSEKLLQLVSDGSQTEDPAAVNVTGNKAVRDHSRSLLKTWEFSPSKELEELLNQRYDHDGLKNCAVADISKAFDLQQVDVLKYRNLTEF